RAFAGSGPGHCGIGAALKVKAPREGPRALTRRFLMDEALLGAQTYTSRGTGVAVHFGAGCRAADADTCAPCGPTQATACVRTAGHGTSRACGAERACGV